MNDILTKQAVKISLVDEGEAKKRTGKVRAGSIFNPLHRWGGGAAVRAVSLSGSASTMFSISRGHVLPAIVTSASFPLNQL